MMNLHIQVYLQREKTVGIAHKWLLPNLQDVRFRGAGWNSCESRRSEKQQQHCVAQAAAGRRQRALWFFPLRLPVVLRPY
jgi:predicted nucleic acid-binding Zn ribbon protein